jgi:hypothetical protein
VSFNEKSDNNVRDREKRREARGVQVCGRRRERREEKRCTGEIF